MAPNEQRLLCIDTHGFHRIAYYEWAGPPAAPTVLCVHGLTRNGRDFDTLAQALSRDFHVVCPDMVGRGKSDWLCHGDDYGYPVYINDIVVLLARLGIEEISLVGTSMGGLIGMLMAAMPHTPVRRLVVNDIGPLIAKEGLERISSYVGQDPSFPSAEAIEAYLRQVSASFGSLTDAQWHHLATHAARDKPDGTLGLAYDPSIAEAFRRGPVQDVDLWAQWDRITCPTLVIRGAKTDLLRASDAEAMTQRGPKAQLYEVANAGHAPALMAEDQIAAIRGFLLG
jgi:pimeloyl-ACP methyl ester carboxylesterase